MNRKVLDTTKQGMQDLKLTQINQTITDYLFGSAKYEMQARKSYRANQKSIYLQYKYKYLSQTQLSAAHTRVETTISYLRAYFTPSITAVLDFDCFYAAVEMRDNPAIRDKPVAVVGGSIVCTSNYAARHYGIRAGMPTRIAKVLCSYLVCIDQNMDKYMAISRSCGQIFAKYDPNFVMLGCDECSLDLTETVAKDMRELTQQKYEYYRHNYGSECVFLKHEPSEFEFCVAQVVYRLRLEVYQHTHLTVSCGVGSSRYLAKIGADMKKPNGQTVMYLHFSDYDAMFSYFQACIGELPIRKIWGIGYATQELLAAAPFNITRIGQIVEQYDVIIALLPPSSINLVVSAHGLSGVFGGLGTEDSKSIGHAQTMPETGDVNALKHIILHISKALCSYLDILNLKARRVQITLRFADWADYQHIDDLPYKTRDLDVVYAKSVSLMQKMFSHAIAKRCNLVTVGIGANKHDVPAYYVRLVGVRLLEFEDEHDGGISYYLKNGRYESIQNTHLDGPDEGFELIGSSKKIKQEKPEKPKPTGAIDRFIRPK